MKATITINLVEPVGEGRFKLETSDGAYFMKEVQTGVTPPTGTFVAEYKMVGEKRVISTLAKPDAGSTEPEKAVDPAASNELLFRIISSPALGSVPKNENEIPEIIKSWHSQLKGLLR
jgi:hypothetical protein